MGSRNICLHAIAGVKTELLSDFSVTAETDSRDELIQALKTMPVDVLVIDLDIDDAVDTVVKALGINPHLAVVGVTGRNDPQFLIAAVRAGCKQLTTKPIDPNDLNIALRRAINETTRTDTQSLTVATVGAIGGAGTTTLACYLAAGLADLTSQRAAIIDVDLEFGNVARSWDLNPPHTIASIAALDALDTAVIERAAVDLRGGVHVIPRPDTIEEAHAIDPASLGKIIENTKLVFPYVVLDLPRKLDATTGCALQRADRLLIVLQLSVPATNNAKRLVTELCRLGLDFDKMEFVVNRCRKNVHNLTPETVEAELGKPILGVIPNDYKSIAKAIDLGEPVAAESPIRAAIREIASKLSDHKQGAATKSGWLSKFRLWRGTTGSPVPTVTGARRKGASPPVPPASPSHKAPAEVQSRRAP